jgi:anti-anti-sigma factor
MSMNNTFTIKQIAGDNNNFTFDLVGAIDAHANLVLDSFSQIPAGSSVLLDFTQVERVNSMGLSLLLKVFENWERQKIRIEVQNLDRMVSMLFKITGLGRFIKSDGNTQETGSGVKQLNPEPPRHAEQKVTPVVGVANDKLNFVASMQSGQQLTGWYLLNTYFQRRMKKAIHFEQTVDVPNPNSTDLLFAKPFEAALMLKEHGFIPVMRPTSEADEVVILTRADDNRILSEYADVCVSTATQNSFVYLLGRFLCDENGLDSSKLTFDFSGNEIKALQTLIRKKSDLAFMLKKTYDGLSSFSKNSVRKLDESQTDFACHLFLVAPHVKAEAPVLGDILAAMADDDQGKQILQDIQIQGWSKPEEGEINMLQMVYDRYRN